MSEHERQSPLYSKITHISFFVCFYLCFLHHADSVSLLKVQDTILLHEILVDFQRSQRSHCELLRGEFYRMKSKVCGLQKELSETKEVKSQLEHQKVEWERELGSLRYCTPRF